MQATLKALVELQNLEIALRELTARRNEGPGRIAELEEAFHASEAEVGAAKHRYEQLRVERDQNELELKSLADKLEKYQAQLMSVKTNKEYSAVLKEIDTVKSEVSRLETEGIAKLEEMETLSKDVPEAEARIAEERGRYEQTRAALESELSEVDARLAEDEARRAEVEREIPPEIVRAFVRIAGQRGGLAVVRIVEAICPACNVRLRIQVVSQIRRGESLITCDSCRRFLYFEEEPAVTADNQTPPPNAESPAGT